MNFDVCLEVAKSLPPYIQVRLAKLADRRMPPFGGDRSVRAARVIERCLRGDLKIPKNCWDEVAPLMVAEKIAE